MPGESMELSRIAVTAYEMFAAMTAPTNREAGRTAVDADCRTIFH
jgi:hypothetical protein